MQQKGTVLKLLNLFQKNAGQSTQNYWQPNSHLFY